MKITICQLNPLVGDIEGNAKKITGILAQTRAQRPDLIIFPELFLTGYPPRDLLEKPWFIQRCAAAIKDLTEASLDHPETGFIFGAPTAAGRDTGQGLFNSAVLIHDGKCTCRHKTLLPSYDVFDEARYFDPADSAGLVDFKGEKLGITICEDAWNHPELWPKRKPYDYDPVADLAKMGASLLINISASPFEAGKERTRFELIGRHAKKHGLPFIYINQVGGNDELVFDGRSFGVDKNGQMAWWLPAFQEEVVIIDSSLPGKFVEPPVQDEIGSIYSALKLGVRDYFRKCGFNQAVVGLSGGIDSAVVAALAAQALGPDNVLGITMPSPFSSQGSVDDSRKLADKLGIALKEISITEVYEKYLEILEPHFEGRAPDIAEENIQARIRGNILMAFSNKFGRLVLTTGNKSELAVGYCTLYGDMSGGLAVISDVPKTTVYRLAEHINRDREIIPRAVITKPPSAELRAGQKDQDTLPPYEILDRILEGYLEDDLSVDQLVGQGLDRDTVEWVARTVRQNEYKRRQSAPGIKVTGKAFGGGRRMPIAAKY
ncbi:MAG: NAD+ synthase [Candidatus Edwardsbacteria bacterium RifOxyA12_full_54_48]|uniref:Glutamine-dependent NAD(+) synthetase n=1 Tax=Candidatus Edwardsbacteria bacterium GWF2_54_11 TaxID=1817851 RepID=A0A1F5RIS8_9BACT|nr:MAG: NAD+ synthase [Candidatus Edwardsbacteria bacterium RifOxyC12_full_54_24]OGF07258.1 MAG: NAD+ synthase [Candidatus Edwardsbacteria bacterium RifOxyA12_full_54_48]OGF09513.1 MAG: NAD+ synthase [Candidatus Edwardsbacteria bacterium GWE2_54_12]OGF14289.1 MAG: NAD+ synthase [Candidatus Edwardsbacteria bacterium GWF2_54_11]OGJ18369.1 MAG: NAD+ synthase [Candidatus Edwardsbacteria bacterium RifOxyB12_full_52_30]HAD82476.1 NAD+ synthase [Candidatus Edwardsbacteria bacterium]